MNTTSTAPENLNTVEERMIQVDIHPTPPIRNNTIPSQFIVLNPKTKETIAKHVRTPGVVNSTRWSDIETRHLLDIWAACHSSLKHKKRNSKDWEMIAKEVHKRCVADGELGLGARTGSQCKIRIKNMVAEYKRSTGQYSQHHSKPTTTTQFLGSIEKVLKNQSSEEFSKLDEGIEESKIKEDGSTMQFTTEVNTTQSAMPAVASPTSVNPSAVMTSFPSSHSNTATISITNPISLAPLHSNGFETHPMVSNDHSPVASKSSFVSDQNSQAPSQHEFIASKPCFVSSQRSQTPSRHEFIAKPKLSRPYKVVKVQKKAVAIKEDEKLLTVVREFMEERRKREEELFDRLFQQQAETEKRYQEFTLNVIKEIGRLFRPDTSNNTSQS